MNAMVIQRYNPLRELLSMQEKMNRLLEGVVGTGGERGDSHEFWEPAADLIQTGDEMTVRIDLPGVDEREIRVVIDQGVLEVSGERRVDDGEATVMRRERSVGPFRRSFLLTDPIDTERVTASFERGVLTVRLPRLVQRRDEPVRIRVDNG